jgi:hypothetical protein
MVSVAREGPESMATVREALDQSPVGRAKNVNPAWGYASIVGAEWLTDGGVVVTVYETEGDFRTATYADPEEASLALFTQQDMEWDVKQNTDMPVTLTWAGANEWQVEAK